MNCDSEFVEIKLIEQVKHTCKADAELYESNLINAYNESMEAKEDKLFNTKLTVTNNKKREPVKLTNDSHILDIATYNNIKRGKKLVEPVIYNSENDKTIFIYYWVDKEKKQKKIRYLKIGYEKGLEKAFEEVETIKELYNNTANKNG